MHTKKVIIILDLLTCGRTTILETEVLQGYCVGCKKNITLCVLYISHQNGLYVAPHARDIRLSDSFSRLGPCEEVRYLWEDNSPH